MGEVSRPRAGGDSEQADLLRAKALAVNAKSSVGGPLPSAKTRPRPNGLSPAMLQRLGRSAGNRAVAGMIAGRPTSSTAGPALAGPASATGVQAATSLASTVGDVAVQRYAGLAKAGASFAPPAPPVPPAPKSDPRFVKVTGDLKKAAKETKKHPPAKGEAKKAQEAAVPPANDRDAQAKAAQADKMAGAKKGGFDKAAFVNALVGALAANKPKNLEEADDFASSGKADQLKSQVAGKVSDGKKAAAQDLEAKAKEPPDPSVGKDKPVTPLTTEPETKPATPGFAQGMPSKAPSEQTDLSGAKNETDAKLKEADVSESDLKKSNEPEMVKAVEAKKEGEDHSTKAPQDLRKSEADTIKAAETGAGGKGKADLAAMLAKKKGTDGQVQGAKGDTKTKDEAKRAEVTGKVNKIFDGTKVDADRILGELDGKVTKAFEAGEAEAKQAFTTTHETAMRRWKIQRYGGPGGGLLWLKDKVMGLPSEVNGFYDAAKGVYLSKMTKVAHGLADLVDGELTRAKERIQAGREEIRKYVGSLPNDLQKVGADAAKNVEEKFNSLESDVDNKGAALQEELASKYTEAMGKVNADIEAMQAENKGLWDSIKNAVGGAIEAILKLKDLFMGILAKAAGAFKKIIADPLAFIGNFMTAVKNGFLGFASRIGAHLKKGLQGWLFGKLGEAGIDIPDKLDLQGIFKMVLSILGLTWSNIRGRLVKRIGEKAMNVLETTSDVFVILVKEGIGGLWKWIVDKVGDLKDMVVGQIRDFVIEKVVKAGITWVIGMLNPAGALIKIIQTLIYVIQWIMEKGAALVELVGTVVDSISDIAHGGMGGVPAKIEDALSKAVPIVISFLASLLGLGGISEKIKSILEAVQKPVMKAVDAVIAGAVKLAGPLIRAAKNLGKKAKAKFEQGKNFVKEKAGAAKDKLKGLLFKPIEKPVDMAGAGHTVHVSPGPKVEMASSRGAIAAQVYAGIAKLKDDGSPESADQQNALANVGNLATKVAGLAAKAEKNGRDDVTAEPGMAAALAALNKAIEAYANKYKTTSLSESGKEGDTGPIEVLKKYGMPYKNFLGLQAVAKKFGVVFWVRSTTGAAIRLLEGGTHLPKPEMIKAKTINKEDVQLGPFTESNVGEVGFFRPQMGAVKKVKGKDGNEQAPEGMDAAQVLSRFGQRAEEYKIFKEYMDKLVAIGKITMVNGLVKDKTSGKGFTGDHDLFRIETADGEPVEAKFGDSNDPININKADKLKAQIVAACKAFGVEHGAHLDWEAEAKKKTHTEAMFLAIKAQHENNNGLLRVAPSGGPSGG